MLATLVRTLDAAPGIRHFTFAVPELSELTFTPGQFVSLSATIGDRKITRAYSLAAPPAGNNQFEICLNRVDGGAFSPYLFSLQPGDAVELSGPLGTFTWRDPHQDALLVATGTGVVPYRAMLHAALPSGGSSQIHLLYGTRHPENLLFVPEFQAFADSHSRFRFTPTVTRPTPHWPPPGLPGATGRVTEHVLPALEALPNATVYICGMAEMVEAVRALCKQQGLDRKRIVTEKYD